MHPVFQGGRDWGLQLHLCQVPKGFPPQGSPLHPLQHPPCPVASARAPTARRRGILKYSLLLFLL